MEKISLVQKVNQFKIKDLLLSEEKIYVPNYQRAYAWESSDKKEVYTFWNDIKTHIESEDTSNFYLGNFIFEEEGNKKLAIIDGQQRFTTIFILLSALKNIDKDMLSEIDLDNFSTVDYDEENFKKILSEEIKDISKINELTDSITKIFNAYWFFKEKLNGIEKISLNDIKDTILGAKCQINIIDSKIEATQVFIFENNRGKTPTNLEIAKTMFMYHVYKSKDKSEKKNETLEKIESTFTYIYRKIAALDGWVKEDFILGISFRLHEKILKIQGNLLDEIEKRLNVEFIKDFLKTLRKTFEYIYDFVIKGKNEKFEDEESYMIHSLLYLGISGELYPIIIRAIEVNVEKDILISLYKAIEATIVRSRIINTSAKITYRLEGLYKESFLDNGKTAEEKIKEIINRISIMLNSEEYAVIENNKEPNKNWWWSYWTLDKFKDNLKNGLKSLWTTKYILWKYENDLRDKNGKEKIGYNKIRGYEVEHIAPKTENKNSKENGYPEYNDEFYSKYLDSFGNLLLLDEKINKSIGNKDFKEKLKNYGEDNLYQQDILLKENKNESSWTIEKIEKREKEIKEYILSEFSYNVKI